MGKHLKNEKTKKKKKKIGRADFIFLQSSPSSEKPDARPVGLHHPLSTPLFFKSIFLMGNM